MRRFIHLLPSFNRLEGIDRTPLNQYDSLILTLLEWLRKSGVDLRCGTAVTDICFAGDNPASTVAGITLDGSADPQRIEVGEQDLVLITLGSMHSRSGATFCCPEILGAPGSDS